MAVFEKMKLLSELSVQGTTNSVVTNIHYKKEVSLVHTDCLWE